MTPAEIRELIEKLRRKTQRFPASGGGSIGIGANGKTTSSSYITDDGYRLVNPDGPEAATVLDELLARVERMELENGRLLAISTQARAASKRAGRDLLREEADSVLPYFRQQWEPLRDIAARTNWSAQSLASRARELQKRGLVESKWFGAERTSSFKVWRAALSGGE